MNPASIPVDETDMHFCSYKSRTLPMSAWTVSFSECVESHIGMARYGETAERGFTKLELEIAAESCQQLGYQTDLYDLCTGLPWNYWGDAQVLVVRDGCFLFPDHEYLIQEIVAASSATNIRVRRNGKIFCRKSFRNLCITDRHVHPDIEQGRGTVLSFAELPYLDTVRQVLPQVFGDKAHNLYAKLNYYYDIYRCGVGYHGDAEHRRVIALRAGENIPLHFQWFYDGRPVGTNMPLDIHANDVYVMAEKAVGYDWRCRTIPTLRHAAGCVKYTDL
jgi:hypothetical protein